MKASKTSFLKATNEIINKDDYRIELYRDGVNIGTLMNLETGIFYSTKKEVMDRIIYEIDFGCYYKNSKKIKTIKLWIQSDNLTCFYEFDEFEVYSI